MKNMNNCCNTPQSKDSLAIKNRVCPHDGTKGKAIQLITLKSLLKSEALENLEPEQSYSFCSSSQCPVVYFSNHGHAFTNDDLKVPVFQKDTNSEVPICYCFNWTRQRIQTEIEQQGESQAVASITAHVKAGRCGCEVNNPQGACCLGNVRRVLENLKLEQISF